MKPGDLIKTGSNNAVDIFDFLEYSKKLINFMYWDEFGIILQIQGRYSQIIVKDKIGWVYSENIILVS